MILAEAVGVSMQYAGGRGGSLRAVDDVSLRVQRGETLGLVGESGCGKSTLGRCLLRLQAVSSGTVRFDGADITDTPMRALRPLRRRMQMVFQDPAGALNPRRRVGDLIAEPLRVHPLPDGSRRSARAVAERVAELVELVGLRADHMQRYSHEFSGGQRQRIGIARALALGPELLVADEPVSALDVSVQAQVVNLMMDLQERLGLTMLFIAHDLAVVRQVATRVAVMYLGRVVETGPVDAVFTRPAHPYTAALLAAVPQVVRSGDPSPPAQVLGGDVPGKLDAPRGCRFRARCPVARSSCSSERPPLRLLAEGREAACHFPLV